MEIRIEKHVRQYRSVDDGVRLLIMRYWPRGVAKTTIDNWLISLAPSATLLHALKNGDLKNDNQSANQNTDDQQYKAFTKLYIEEMGSPDSQLCIRGLAQELKTGATITLLCGCHEPAHCHRSILKKLILECLETLES